MVLTWHQARLHVPRPLQAEERVKLARQRHCALTVDMVARSLWDERTTQRAVCVDDAI
jgi:hypothetical protein